MLPFRRVRVTIATGHGFRESSLKCVIPGRAVTEINGGRLEEREKRVEKESNLRCFEGKSSNLEIVVAIVNFCVASCFSFLSSFDDNLVAIILCVGMKLHFHTQLWCVWCLGDCFLWGLELDFDGNVMGNLGLAGLGRIIMESATMIITSSVSVGFHSVNRAEIMDLWSFSLELNPSICWWWFLVSL